MSIEVPKSNPVVKAKRLWQLLELALADLAAAEKMPNMCVDMYAWVRRHHDKKCSVCLAGAVMMFELPVVMYDARSESNAYPSQYEPVVYNRLHALNSLRTGDIEAAADEFYQGALGAYSERRRKILDVQLAVWRYAEKFSVDFPEYAAARPKANVSRHKRWWKVMRYMLKKLKTARL